MSPSELRLEAPVGCSGRDVAFRPGYAAGGLSAAGRPGTKSAEIKI